ncbi:MAG: AbrB/MazE/SpoVT family DNA-binding domain-containing protein [Anaerolineae bacterium]
MRIVVLSTKGQIVLPREIRKSLGLQKGDRLSVILEGERIVLVRSAPNQEDWQRWRGCLAGSRALQEHLAEHAEEVRR